MELKVDSIEDDNERGFGFVSGIVDKPLTPMERANGFIGHTEDEWLAYNQGAGHHPLKNNHGETVGRIVHTYVDNRGNLCASAMIDRKRTDLWDAVRAGKINSFSIGFNADPSATGGVPYKNSGFEVSLTSTPRLPFATIKVRCSNTMADSTPAATTPPVPAPAAAAATPTPAPPVAAPPSAVSAPPEPMDVDVLRQLDEARQKAAQWDAYQQAERERVYKENMAKVTAVLPALRDAGMDVDNEGHKAILDTLARVQETSPLLSAFEKLAAERAALRAEKEAALARVAEEKARADAEAAASQRNMSFLDALKMQFGGSGAASVAGGEAKRQVTPQTWNATAPAAMAPADALRLGLGAIDPSLFQAASARASAAATTPTVAPVPPSQAAAAPVPDNTIPMPETPEARLAMMYALHANRVPMTAAVRCSAETEEAAVRRVQTFARENPDSFGARCVSLFTPAFSEAMFGDSKYWNAKSEEFANTGRLPGCGLAVTTDPRFFDLANIHRPVWDRSLPPLPPVPATQ